MTLWERVEALAGRIAELESGRRETTADMLDFHHRLRDIESRLPKPVPVVEPVVLQMPPGDWCPAADLKEACDVIMDMLATEGTIGGLRARDRARNFLARVRCTAEHEHEAAEQKLAALVAQLEAALSAEAQLRANCEQDAADEAELRTQLEALLLDRSDERYGPGGGAVYVPQLRALLARHPATPPTPIHAALVAQVARLTSERDEARAEYARLQTSIDLMPPDSLRAEVARLTEALALMTEGRDHYFERAEAAEQKLAAAERTIESNNAKWAKLADECRELLGAEGKARAAAEQKLAAAERESERVREVMAARVSALEVLEAVTVPYWKERTEAAEQKLAAAERETFTGRNNAAKVQELGYALQQSEQKLAAAERARIEERGRWEQKLSAAEQCAEAAEARCRELQAESDGWQNECAQARERVRELEEQRASVLALVEARVRELTETAQAAQQRTIDAAAALAEAESELAQLRGSYLGIMTKAYDNASNQWDAALTEIAQLRERVRDLEAALAGASADAETELAARNAAESELAQLRKRVAKAEDHQEYHRTEDPHALEDAQRRLADSESHCRALSEDLARANLFLAELDKGIPSHDTVASHRRLYLSCAAFDAFVAMKEALRGPK